MMCVCCKLNLINVSGKQMMIAQGSDAGLSREGVMKGDEMRSFNPLHLSALERLDGLKKWIRMAVAK